jgi:hypothetical protein
MLNGTGTQAGADGQWTVAVLKAALRRLGDGRTFHNGPRAKQRALVSSEEISNHMASRMLNAER